MKNLLITQNHKSEIITIAQGLNPKALLKDPRHLRGIATLRLTLGLKKDEIDDQALGTMLRRCPKTREYTYNHPTFKRMNHLGFDTLKTLLGSN